MCPFTVFRITDNSNHISTGGITLAHIQNWIDAEADSVKRKTKTGTADNQKFQNDGETGIKFKILKKYNALV